MKIHVPKMLVEIALATSRSSAERLCKSGAVEIWDEKGEKVWPKSSIQAPDSV